MSNRQSRKKNRPPAGWSRNSRLVVFLITLALMCVVGASLLAQVSLRSNGGGASSEVSLASFNSNSPSREYIYTGGRLVATEEPGTVPAPNYQGFHDGADCSIISGWAWNANQPNTPINVDVYNGTTLIATVAANQFRQDLANGGYGNGNHGFVLSTPASLKDGQTHSIRVKFSGTSTDLYTTPKSITCSP